ncbi:MAG: B12-binding domain-containing radical SAM protein [Alkaliphilus sp.]
MVSTFRYNNYDLNYISFHNESYNLEESIIKIKETEIDYLFIMISYYRNQFFDENFRVIDDISKAVKVNNSNAKVFVSGSPIKLIKTELFEKCKNINFLCQANLYDIITQVYDPRNRINDTKGIYYKAEGNIVETGMPIMKSAHLKEANLLETVQNSTEYATIITSEGCSNVCKFCVVAAEFEGRWLYRDLDEVMLEITSLSKYNTKKIIFGDSSFFGHKLLRYNQERCRNFCDLLKRNSSAFIFKLSTRIDNIDKEMIDMLGKNGLAFLFVGIESGVQRVLDDFNKNTTPDKSVYMLKTISEHNVVPQIGFIFFDPYITLEEIKMNIRFLSEIKSYTFFSLLSIDKLIVLKGTEYASQNQSKINFKENGGEFTYSFTCELIDLIF